MNLQRHTEPTASGFAILHGNLAPEGSVIRLEGLDRTRFDARARVFDDVTVAVAAIMNRAIVAGDMIVYKASILDGTEGAEDISAAIVAAGLKGVGLMVDVAIGACPSNPVIGHVAPSAAKGGPISRLREGDTISIDIEARSITAKLEAEIIPVNGAPKGKKSFGALEKYQRLVSQPDAGQDSNHP